jgi:hypothetical protein
MGTENPEYLAAFARAASRKPRLAWPAPPAVGLAMAPARRPARAAMTPEK